MAVISWLIIGGMLVAVLFLAKMKHVKHKFFGILIVMLLLFLYVTFPRVADTHGIEVRSLDGFSQATKVYLAWLGHSFGNVKTITGDVVKMDWGGNLTEP